MNSDHKIINSLMELECGKNRKILDLFRGDWEELSQKQELNSFVRVCKKLASQHQFKPILDFVYEVFCTRKDKDLKCLKEQLSKVTIDRNGSLPYTLADLSHDYLTSIIFYKAATDLGDLDLFLDCPDNLFPNNAQKYNFLEIMSIVILQNVYGVYTEEFGMETVDHLVEIVRNRAKQAHQKECERIDARNADIAKYTHMEKVVHPEFTVFERDLVIPGMLMPFIRETEKKVGKQNLCYYMLEKYVFPALEATPWEQENNPEIPGIAWTVRSYADYLQALQYWKLPDSEDVYSLKDEDYVKNTLYYEALDKGDPGQYRYADSKMAEYAHSHVKAFRQWANILHRGGAVLKQTLRPQGYSFHMLNTAFMLHFGGQTEDACQFLLQHYSDISEYEKCKPHLQILLTRCILSTTHLETANALYGTFSYEMDRVYWGAARVLDLTRQMVQFLRDAKSYIRKSNKYAYTEKVSWFDILFHDGQIDSLLEQCKKELQNGDILNYRLFRKLALHVDAFSYRTGVHLGYLGLGRYDDYDKLEKALSEQLRLRGEGCMTLLNDAKVFYARRAQSDTLRSIDLHLQNHVTKLQQDRIKEKLEQVMQLKANKLTEVMDEKQREELLREIEEITDELTHTAKEASLWRPWVEREIRKLLCKFEQDYANVLVGKTDLMNKLRKNVREDVHNYLVTSNMVFQMMKTQNDAKLDYSAALISMTKALELVMRYIYLKLTITEYADMDPKDKRFYFDCYNHVKKDKQTLQPCIDIFKEEKRIKAWGVENVLDLSLLEKFSEIKDLKVEKMVEKDGKYYREHCKVRKGTHAYYASKLRLALTHVCQKYRNGTAHANFIGLVHVEECQRLLLEGERLLWILLAIMK